MNKLFLAAAVLFSLATTSFPQSKYYIIFKYKDTLIKCFENGKLEYYPEGMCDNSLIVMGCLTRNNKSNDIIKMFKDRYGNYNQN